jgi:hypothetical protein
MLCRHGLSTFLMGEIKVTDVGLARSSKVNDFPRVASTKEISLVFAVFSMARLLGGTDWDKWTFGYCMYCIVIFQHPVGLYTSDLGVSAPSRCNVIDCSFIGNYFTRCFGLTSRLQVYRCCEQRLCCSL